MRQPRTKARTAGDDVTMAILYLGVLAPRAVWRSEVVQYTPPGEVRDVALTETLRADDGDGSGAVPRRPGARLWAGVTREAPRRSST